MLCERCKKNEATIKFKASINGDEVSYCLCPSCHNAMFGSLNSALDADMLDGLFSAPVQRNKMCPECGMNYSEFERTGLLGCPACYETFKDDLLPYIERIQGKVKHVGKVAFDDAEQELTRKLQDLQESLEIAWQNGRRGEVQEIYAQIEKLKNSMTGKGEN